MEVELFIHGVPSGEGFWGREEDRNYFGTFYDHSSDEVKFLIQTRAFRGKLYCYYNYLVYKTFGAPTPNIVANDGRDGSYFGITLRLDAYCKDILNMYRILDTIYNLYVVGNLLKMEKMKLKYTIPDFASASNSLEAIENTTMQMVQSAFNSESFARLEGFATNGASCATYNLYDCKADIIMGIIKQYSKVAISPYYPNSKESAIQQQCNAQIQSIKQQCDARLKADAEIITKEKDEINTSLLSTKKKLAQLEGDIEQKTATIKQQQQELTRLQSEIRNMGQTKKISQIVAPIREPISELVTLLEQTIQNQERRELYGKRANDTNKGKESKTTSFVQISKALLPFFNFFLLLAILFILLSLSKSKAEVNSYTQMAMNESFEKVKQDSQNEDSFMIDNMNNTSNLTTSDFDINIVKIDINGYNGKNLTLHGEYNVEAKNGASNARWEGEGCEIKQYDSANPNKVKIIPTDANVIITYYVGDKSINRQLTAK